MGLDLLKSISIITVLFFSGCSKSIVSQHKVSVEKKEPSWIENPTQNGTRENAASACYINKHNYSKDKIKKILLMKIKSAKASSKSVLIETKQTKVNSRFNRSSRQSSSGLFVDNYKIIDKYKHKNRYCIYVEF